MPSDSPYPEREVLEVEAVPLDEGGEDEGERDLEGARNIRVVGNGLLTVLAGLVIDVVDFATFGVLGVFVGLPLGAFAGHWLAKNLGFSPRACARIAAGCGLYCMLPPTNLLPVATLLALGSSLFKSRNTARVS